MKLVPDDSTNNVPIVKSHRRPEVNADTVEILPIQALRFQQNMLSDDQVPF